MNNDGQTCRKWVSQVINAIGPKLGAEIQWPTDNEFALELQKTEKLMSGVCEGAVCD
jgi:hypothetical protein